MKVDVSVVVPVLNEKESLPELISQIDSSLKKIKKSYEIIFIDDGSSDGSLDLEKKFARQKKNIHVFAFRHNLGKSPALTYGFLKSSGKFVVTMDADLQDDPKNLATMFKTLEKNNLDMVSGWRKHRRDSGFKVITSKMFNSLVSLLFRMHVHDLNCGLKLYKREVTQDLFLYGGMHRFIPVLVSEMGFKIGEAPIVHHARKYGVSKYKPTKMLTDLPDLFTIFFLAKYNRRPLHFFGKIGGAIFLFGGLILFSLTIDWLMGKSIGRRPLLIFGVLFVITGIQIIFAGLLADLITSNKHEDISNFPIKFQSKK